MLALRRSAAGESTGAECCATWWIRMSERGRGGVSSKQTMGDRRELLWRQCAVQSEQAAMARAHG